MLMTFAHRHAINVRSITDLIYNFTQGMDIPAKVKRGDEILPLHIVIE